MRLVIATPLYPPESGGPATFAKALEEGLKSRGWTGETVRFSAVRDLPKLVRHVAYFWHVYRAARRSDVVLALDPVSTGVPALLAARLAFKPFYVRIAGDYAWEQGTSRFKVTDSLTTFTCKTRYPFPVRILKAVQSYVAIAATGIIVPNKTLATVVHLWNIPRQRVAISQGVSAGAVDQLDSLFKKHIRNGIRTVVLATPLYPPEPGGPATYAKLVEEKLPAYGIQVHVVPFSRVRSYPRIIRHMLYTYIVFAAARRAELILVQDTVSCGVPALIASYLSWRPLIVRVPGDYAWEQATQRFGVSDTIEAFQQKRGSFPVMVLKWLQRMVVQHARLVIVPSKYFATIVRQWGVPEERLMAIYHGVELPPILVPKNRPTGKLLVSSGRLVPWKGFDTLLSLLPNVPEWTLVIIGSGPDFASLQEHATQLGVHTRVIFTGALPRDEALGWCSIADAFVLDTQFESFSFQIVEALQLGVPIITTNIGSIPELITTGEQGVLLSPGDVDGYLDAIHSLQTNPAVWLERTAAAKVRGREFSTEAMLRTTASAIKRVI